MKQSSFRKISKEMKKYAQKKRKRENSFASHAIFNSPKTLF